MTIRPDTDIIRPGTWLAAAMQGQTPRKAQPGTALISAPLTSEHSNRVMYPTKSGHLAPFVLLDGGNGAIKLAVPVYQAEENEPIKLYVRRIETCYGRPIRSRDVTSRQLQYVVDGNEPIRIGDPSRSQTQIPPGSTATRFADGMYRQLLFAAVVETLHEAGWTPATASHIYLGYAVPSNDFGDTGDLNADAVAALKTLAGGVAIRRIIKADTQDWQIRIAGIYYGDQSCGTYYGISRSVSQHIAITGITTLRTIDIGYGHTHGQIVEINEDGSDTTRSWELESGLRLAAERLVSLVAEQHGERIEQAQAQLALRNGTYTLGAGDVAIADLVEQALEYAAPKIISAAESNGMAESRGILIVSGGGVAHPVMRRQLAVWLDNGARAKRPNYLISGQLAGFANAIGMYGLLTGRLTKARPWR